jgi:D-alanyl-D-alanine carboxypeptidase
MLDIGFAGRGAGTQIASLPDTGGSAPNMRSQICTSNRQEPSEDDYAVPVAANGSGGMADSESSAAFFANDGRSSGATLSSGVSAIQAQMASRPYFEPIPVFIGRAPGYTGPVVGARDLGRAPAVGAAVTAAIAARAREAAKSEKAEKIEKPAKVQHAQARPAPKTKAKIKAKAEVGRPKAKTAAKPQKPKT